MTLIDACVYQSSSKGFYGKGYLHLHPDVGIKQVNEATFLLNDRIELTFRSDKYNSSIIELETTAMPRATIGSLMLLSFPIPFLNKL